MDYQEYLKSDEWKRTREAAILRGGKQCALCCSHDYLNVHHNTYERLGSELDSDVVVLCKTCHEKFHDVLPEPNEARTTEPKIVPGYRGNDPVKLAYARKRKKLKLANLPPLELAKLLTKLRADERSATQSAKVPD